jgi:multidrug efflux system outer membrane protein
MEIHLQTASAFLLTVLLAGCAIGPRYHDPKFDVPDKYREFQVTANRESMADLPWWEVFKDDALKNLIREAIASNYDLKIAAARVEEARTTMGYVRSNLFPKTDLTASGERDRNSQSLYPSLDRLTNIYSSGFQTGWEIDLWGQIRQQVSAAKSEWIATEEAQRGVLVSLVADVATSYFTLCTYDLQLKIAVDTLKIRGDTLDLFKKREKGGVASHLEVTQAEADYRETAANIPELERQISIQENHINLLLGKNPGSIPRGKALGEQYYAPDLPPSGLPADLLKRRPDIVEAEQHLRATTALTGAAVGNFLPKLNMLNFVGGAGHQPKDIWSANGYTWQIGGDVKFPLFKGGENYYKYKMAKARWEKSLENYKLKATDAFREVADSLRDIQKYRQVREEQEKRVVALREGAQLARMRYEGGVSSYLEVLDAERNRFNGENTLADVQGKQLNAYAALYRSLGGGWQQEEKPA